MFVKKFGPFGAPALHIFENLLFLAPLMVVIIMAISLAQFIITHNFIYLTIFVLAPYSILPLLFRIINFFIPLKEGAILMKVGEKGYTPWMGALHLQNFYNLFPVFERVLKLFPPLYLQWLRIWGSQIGKNTFIQAKVDILDRTSVEIGDGVFVGHGAVLTSHLVNKVSNGFLLIHKKIKIGKDAFVAGGSVIGPGVIVESGGAVPFRSELIHRQKIRSSHEN